MNHSSSRHSGNGPSLRAPHRQDGRRWSVVVVGVLEHLTEQQVADELVEGTAHDLPEAAWARLSMLRVQCIAKWVRDEERRPDRNPMAPAQESCTTGEHQNS